RSGSTGVISAARARHPGAGTVPRAVEPLLAALGVLEPAQAEHDEDARADEHHLDEHHAAARALVGDWREAPRPRRGDVRRVVGAVAPEEDVRERDADEPDEPERREPCPDAVPARARQ